MDSKTSNEFQPTLENDSANSINDSKQKKSKEFNRKLAFLLCVILFAIIAPAIFFFFASGKFSEYQTTASAREIFKFDQNSAFNETDQNFVQPANQTLQSTNFFEDQFSSTKATMSKIVDLITESNSNLTSLTEEFFQKYQNQTELQTVSSQLESLIAKQDNLADLLDYRLFEIQMLIQNQLNPETIETTTESLIEPEYPPFRLISIDLWNNIWHAVLELEGVITMIESNAERAGWLLISINHNAQSAKFRSQSGKEVQLKVRG